MKKILILAGILLAIIIFVFKLPQPINKNSKTINHKNAEYTIEGQKVKLVDGFGQTSTDPKMTVSYFGNELYTDLNDDGIDDVVFLVTVQSGGTGTFYYVLAALTPSTETDKNVSFKGSDGYFLGDRIAPQNIELSKNPKHKKVIVINYADRNPGEPMSAQPSLTKSEYIKLDSGSMRWGIVVADFEGESR